MDIPDAREQEILVGSQDYDIIIGYWFYYYTFAYQWNNVNEIIFFIHFNKQIDCYSSVNGINLT